MIKKYESELISAYKTGKPVRQIAREFSIAQTTLYNVLKRNNIPYMGKEKVKKDTQLEVIEMYNKGASIADIVTIKGLSSQTIYGCLRKHDVKKRRVTKPSSPTKRVQVSVKVDVLARIDSKMLSDTINKALEYYLKR